MRPGQFQLQKQRAALSELELLLASHSACFHGVIVQIAGATAAAPAGQVYCANLLGNSGRNTVSGPGLQDFDFSLFKNNPVRRISETFNVQFRWEVFNIFNQANFNPPRLARDRSLRHRGALNNAGLLTSPTITTSRQMQFALKFIW